MFQHAGDCGRAATSGSVARSVFPSSDIPHFREIFPAAFFSCAKESYGRSLQDVFRKVSGPNLPYLI